MLLNKINNFLLNINYENLFLNSEHSSFNNYFSLLADISIARYKKVNKRKVMFYYDILKMN
jgi:hypothetical protein